MVKGTEKFGISFSIFEAWGEESEGDEWKAYLQTSSDGTHLKGLCLNLCSIFC